MVLTFPSPQGSTFADLLVLAGQSNMRGRAPLTELPSDLTGLQSNEFIWRGATAGFQTLQAPNNNGYTQAADSFGPEMQLGSLAKQQYGSVWIVKLAIAGTSLCGTTGDTWNPDIRGSLYDQLLSEISAALRAIRNSGKIPRPRGMVWAQGEADAQLSITQNDYQTKQTTVFNAVRAAVSSPALPIADILVRSKNFTVTTVNGAKSAVSTALNSSLIVSDGMSDIGDSVHLSGPAQLAFGRHAWERFVTKSYDLPASLPARAFELSAAKQTEWELGGVQSISQWSDLSGNAGHFTQATATARPQLIDGNDKGNSAIRALSGTRLDGPANPVPANGSYTVFYMVENFIGPTVNSPRVPISTGTNASWLVFYAAGSDKVLLRNGTTIIMTSSLGIATADQQIVVLTYRSTNKIASTIRINGAEVATSITKANHSGGTLTLFDHAGNAFTNADFRRMGLVVGGLTQAQEETLEGGLAHTYGLTSLLPASHPYSVNAPV